MKKNLFGLLAATVLLSACSQDDIYKPASGDEANVSIKIELPKMMSRAYSDGTTATHLQYAVYEQTVSGTDTTYRKLDKYTVTDETINISKQINFTLVNGHTYSFVFWAAASNADTNYAVNFGDAGASMKITYDGFVKANLEDLDAFFVREDLTVKGDIEKTFVLRRPFAQINVGTNDYADAEAVGYVPFGSSVKVTGIYDTLDLITGEISGTAATRSFAYNVIDKTQSFPVDGYDYLAMAYVLVPKSQDLVTVSFSYAPVSGTEETRQVGSVPVQRNYRTNLFGSILTSDATVNVIIEPDYYDPDYQPNEIIMQAAIGGTITLEKDEAVENDIIFRKDGVLNLNGNTLTVDNSSIAINAGSEVTINGDGAIVKNGEDAYGSTAAVYVTNGTVTINGGNISSDGVEAVYVQKGTAYITGGYFAAANPYNGAYFTLNCNDANFKNGTAKIIVTGGTFENFNPAETSADFNADGSNGNLVADGYKSIPVTINGKSCWMVVPEEIDVVTASPEEANEALSQGKHVVLTQNLTFEGAIKAYGNALAGFELKNNAVLDGGGYIVTVTGVDYNTYDCSIEIESGTLKNMTITDGFRGILVNMDKKGDVFIDNVHIPADSKITYGLNVNESSDSQNNVYVSNSTLRGWCSWGGCNAIYFTNCFFGLDQNTTNPNEGYQNGLIKPHRTSVFQDCAFDPMVYMDLSSLQAGQTITFINCTVDGEKLTEANHKNIKGALVYGETDWEAYESVKDRVFFK